jgi:hypothetical protein
MRADGGRPPRTRAPTAYAMTVAQLRAALERLDPSMRVVVPGQVWGWADATQVVSQTLGYAPVPGRPDMGGWVSEPLDDPRYPRERCVILSARPSTLRPPRARSYRRSVRRK